MLYAAYGSNLLAAQMAARCPGALRAGSLLLPGFRLVMNRFASAVPDASARLPVGLWRVTEAHLAALDRFEGPHAYERRSVPLPEGGEAWIYLEIAHRPPPPAPDYVARCRAGTLEFGLPTAALEAALAAIGWAGEGGAAGGAGRGRG
ncbi:MAG: gamma-glutamylcyclotransferase [Acetobacteraceae bacterium]|nr:gamma-glutamylcyclotransferase [Acetobacteraceae bacterium]MDW8398059.1 gamma-glutamylcyclotransferase family protein [Acetobacteraceae bacterium]